MNKEEFQHYLSLSPFDREVQSAGCKRCVEFRVAIREETHKHPVGSPEYRAWSTLVVKAGKHRDSDACSRLHSSSN